MISIGDKLDGKYAVAARLGAGGFGEVFLAEDEAIPGRQVALKVLTRRSNGDHRDLIWEMQTLAKFNHPGIVGFHHHFTQQGQLVLVMEYCAGGGLDDRVQPETPVSLNDAFRWGSVLCDTLGFVHGKGIVHHDIKPANILFAHDGAIKVGDFGIANRDAGTRIYMPPEMLGGGHAAKTDARVDVYALGLTLLEMLTGENPFSGLSADEAFKARTTHDFVPESLPRWAQEILLRATHPTPELRFQNMSEFGEAINGKHVPYVFDGNRIKAHALAEKAESQLAKKKWKAAEKLADHAVRLSPDSATALIAAGRCQLFIRRLEAAREHFGHALRVNPRIHVQKELGWLNLEEGHIPIAISFLSDHLDRNASDFEAYNLLLKCFLLSERYEAGENLARVVMEENVPSDCFKNNRFICRLLNGGYTNDSLVGTDAAAIVNPFIAHNLAVAREQPRSWDTDGKRPLRTKLVFQEYRFGLARGAAKSNPISIRLPDGEQRDTSSPVVSIGWLASNDIVLKDRSVSRRHAVIVNYPDEVWLYDLGSTCGTKRDKELVSGRMFLDGAHRIAIGDVEIDVAARADLLV